MAALWAEALPNGRGVLFTVTFGTAEQSFWGDRAIAVADIETGRHEILVAGSYPRYAASGHVLYITADGTLMAMPFDQNGLTRTGDPIPAATGLRVVAGGLQPADMAISSTGTLLYVTGSSGAPDDLVRVTRDGVIEPIDPEWRKSFDYPSLSPDGTQLALCVSENSEQHVWIKELDRPGPGTKLSLRGIRNCTPAWLPDGLSVAYHHRDASGNHYRMVVKRADGNVPDTVLAEADSLDLSHGVFSSDGRWLVYERRPGNALGFGLSGDVDIVALRLDQDSAPVVTM